MLLSLAFVTRDQRRIGCAHELHAHAHVIGARTNCSHEHVLRSEPVSNVLDVDGLTVETSDRAGWSHAKLPNTRQTRDDGVGDTDREGIGKLDAVAEVLVRGIAAEVLSPCVST